MMKKRKETTSQKIRELWDAGLTIAEIARHLGIRYQFAYNVVSYYVLQKELEVTEDDTGHVAASSDSVVDGEENS